MNAILADVREARAKGIDLVSLMRGEPDFRTPEHIVDACVRALREGRTAYPDNRGEKNFREAIAAKLLRDNGLVYDPGTEILATSGATFGIYAALTALISEGDEVLLPDPIYDAYHSPVILAGGSVRTASATITDSRFSIGIEALESAWTPRIRVMILNTPWNPVGTVFTRDELRAIADFCVRKDIILVSDEIYEAITYDGHKHVSPVTAAPELRERSVIVNSLSKTYAMTGWRVGYCAGPRRFIDRMYLALAQSSRGPATFAQDAAATALAAPQDCVTAMRDEYARRRELVARELPMVTPPEGGFFAIADVRGCGEPSDAVRRRLLCENGVVVAHGSAYGAAGEGFLRVSFASGGEVLTEGLRRLREGLLGSKKLCR